MVKYSYAKINLALNVVNKTKPSNLHTLDMINFCISLKDKINISFPKTYTTKIEIICNDPTVPTDSKNTIYQVVEKFQKTFKLDFAIKIKVLKSIPSQSGMGGASANAATVLKVLDSHFKTKMSVIQQMKFIESITSDGPFMIISSPARVKGTGNVVQPYNIKLKGSILVVKPKTGCSTKDIYGKLNYQTLKHPNINKIEEGLLSNNLELVQKNIGNSLMESAMENNSEISDIINRLKTCGFEIVSLSGSGSTCFAYSKNKDPYKRAKEIIDSSKYELVGIYKIINKNM